MTSPSTNVNQNYAEKAPSLAEVKALEGHTILEFGAPWCPHCQVAQEVIQQGVIESKSQPLSHLKIYDGKGKRLGRAFKVKLWPTLVFLQNGKEISRTTRPTKISDMRELLQQAPVPK
ncbi:MAG: thioredoxin family protein [Arenicella sp.]